MFMYCAQWLHHSSNTIGDQASLSSMQFFLFLYESKPSLWFYDNQQLLSTIFVFVVQFFFVRYAVVGYNRQPIMLFIIVKKKKCIRFMFKEKDMYRKNYMTHSFQIIYFLDNTNIFSYFNATFTIVKLSLYDSDSTPISE